jgi:hypothetical protein
MPKFHEEYKMASKGKAREPQRSSAIERGIGSHNQIFLWRCGGDEMSLKCP